MENCEVGMYEEVRRNFVATVKNIIIGQRLVGKKVIATITRNGRIGALMANWGSK